MSGYRKHFLFFIFYIVLLQESHSDLSKVKKTFVSIECVNHTGNNRRDLPKRVGFVISNNCVISAIAIPPHKKAMKKTWCQAIRKEREAPLDQYIRESWKIEPYSTKDNTKPNKVVQVQVLILEAPFTFGAVDNARVTMAEPIDRIVGWDCSIGNENVTKECKVYTFEKDGIDLKEKNVVLKGDGECKNDTLNEGEAAASLLCITMEDGGDACDLTSGSGIVCDQGALVGIVSEDDECQSRKWRAGANLCEQFLREWLYHTVTSHAKYRIPISAQSNEISVLTLTLYFLIAFILSKF
uniref:Peptidase S1 domain-containing protein n=1 Tax=Glossina austeni TaxID=7395 RepID=A0A1A9V2D0_GLOAU